MQCCWGLHGDEYHVTGAAGTCMAAHRLLDPTQTAVMRGDVWGRQVAENKRGL